MNGFLSIIKPAGMTSSDVVLFVRKRLPRDVKVGHGGTLDPEAAGLLPISIGRATRLFDYMIDKEKEYIAELFLGVATDTQDATGRIVEEGPADISPEAIQRAIPQLVGDILQRPPMYSAIQRDGRRLYDLARKGEQIDIEPRAVRVEQMEYLGPSGENRHRIRVVCRKGVYIRTLMYDLGALLGCPAHMSFLLRSRAGRFELSGGSLLEELNDFRAIECALLPLDYPIDHLPMAFVHPSDKKRALSGGPVRPVQGDALPRSTPLRVYLDGEFLGVGVIREGEDAIRFQAMLAEGGAGG